MKKKKKNNHIKKQFQILDLAIIGVASALLIAVQVGLSFLPNIELVSLLLILFALYFKEKTIYIIYVFALVQGILYGFHIWWITYLYIWTLLYFLANAFQDMRSPLGWAILCGGFGLFFGALSAIPYLFISGIHGAIAYFLSGMLFDIMHCAGNFLLTLVLFKPLDYALGQLLVHIRYTP